MPPALTPNAAMQQDAYLKVIQKQNERERQRRRRGKNNYHFPEGDDDIDAKDRKKQSQYNNSSDDDDDDGYSGNRGYSNQQGKSKVDLLLMQVVIEKVKSVMIHLVIDMVMMTTIINHHKDPMIRRIVVIHLVNKANKEGLQREEILFQESEDLMMMMTTTINKLSAVSRSHLFFFLKDFIAILIHKMVMSFLFYSQ